MNNSGQSIVAVLVSAVIMAIVMSASITMFRSQNRATRNIAALGGVSDLSHALDALFGSPQCASTGSYLSGGLPPAGHPVSVTVTAGTPSVAMDTILFANGALAITSTANASMNQMLQPYAIGSTTGAPIQWAYLGGGSSGANPTFPFQVKISFVSTTGDPPPPPLNKFVMLYTSGASSPYPVVGGCYAATVGSSPVQFVTAAVTETGIWCWTPLMYLTDGSGNPVSASPQAGSRAAVHWTGAVQCPAGYHLIGGGGLCEPPLAVGGGVTLSSYPKTPNAQNQLTAWYLDCCASVATGAPNTYADGVWASCAKD